jgi:hypothetical protein
MKYILEHWATTEVILLHILMSNKEQVCCYLLGRRPYPLIPVPKFGIQGSSGRVASPAQAAAGGTPRRPLPGVN